MLRSVLSVAASEIIISSDSNQISIINIFEGIQAEGFPILVPKICFFVLWRRDEEDPVHFDGTYRVTLDDEEILATPGSIDFGEALVNRSRIDAQGVVLQKPGTVTFHAEAAGASASFSFEVKHVAPKVIAKKA